MKLNNLTILIDSRTDCYSVMYEVTIKDYLNVINDIYKNKGGIEGQREPLKSSSAMRIRKQMVKDIIAGTVLPPVVLGLIIDETNFDAFDSFDNEAIAKLVIDSPEGNLTIIDGMQRTTALHEAIELGADDSKNIRIELWVSRKLNSLIYRMLVLNTGQVPWNIRRQIETVFSSMINEMQTAIPEMEIYTVDDANRRSRGGQYHANDLIELYLAFGGRKEKVDTKQRLADEFTRLDFIEATEDQNFSEIFYSSLKRLALLDIGISRFESEENDNRFSNGKDLFKSQPARVGLITAIAKKIFGRPGTEKSLDQINSEKENVFSKIDALTDKLNNLESQELESFLALDLLSEKLLVKSSRVGDFEREFFTKSFETLIDVDASDLQSLEVCWLAY